MGAAGSPRIARGLALRLAAGLAVLALAAGVSQGFADPAPYRGRRLVDVLAELKTQGLNLVYSSAVVGEDLRIEVEPRPSTGTRAPRALLEEILPPLGLEMQDGPAGSILILRSTEPPAGSIRGRVRSSAHGGPIAGAVVRVVGTDLTAPTRPDGSFEIAQVPAGVQEIVVESPGFSPATLGNIRVPPGRPVSLTVTLEGQPRYVEEVVVTPGKLSIVREETSLHRALDNQDTVLAPTIGGDVNRIVELIPGVAAPDNSSAFNVRGSLSRDVSLVLDSLELYEPFHLQSFQQPFSFIDSKIIDSIDFFGGGYTADLGDRHGGFVRMATSATQDPNRARIEVGTINTRLSYGAPWSKGSWLASARAWYPQEMGNTIEIGEEGVEPRFEDLYLKGSFNLSPNVVLSAHMLAAQDRLDFNSPDDAESVDSANRTSHVWLRMLGSWSPRLASETVVSAGRMDRSRKGFSEADVSDTEKALVEVADRRSVNFTGVKQDMTWEIADAHLLRAGVDLRWLEADYRYDTHATSGEFPTTSTSLDPTGTSFGAFTTYRTLLGPSLVVEAGLRWDRQSYTDDSQISPRLNTVWRLGQRSELRFAVGRFSQSQRIHELRVEDGETEFQPAETSRQIDLTFQHELPGGLRLRIDAYDWRITDVQSRAENLFNPLELFPETERDRVILSPTSARLSGVELLVRGAQDKPFYWWASGTWSSAVDTIDGHDEPRSWDQPFAAKFLVGYHAADRWSLSLAGTGHTGWPTTPVTATRTTLPDGTVEIERVVGERNSERFPWYLRFDAKLSRSFPVRGGRLRLDVEVLNVTNRKNVCCVDEIEPVERPNGSLDVESTYDYWLGITPSASILWEF